MPDERMDTENLKGIIQAFEAQEKDTMDVLRSLERENLYVPIDVITAGGRNMEFPVLITLSDQSQCIAVFSSDTVIDTKFYNRHTWRRMGYVDLETFVLKQATRRNVIIDPYSEQPFMLKLDVMEQIAKAREKSVTESGATLDTDVDAFQEAIRKARLVLPLDKEVSRAYALTYSGAGASNALCFVLELIKGVREKEVFEQVFKRLYRTIGPGVPMIILSYREVRAEIRELKAEPFYTRA